MQVRQGACIEDGGQGLGKPIVGKTVPRTVFSSSSYLTGLIMGEPEQPDHEAAGRSGGQLGLERLPAAAVFRAREELVAPYEVGQRTRLLAEAVDDVAIVDDMGMGATPTVRGAAARQGLDVAPGQEQLDPVIEDPGAEVVADQAGGHGVEDFPRATKPPDEVT